MVWRMNSPRLTIIL